MKCFFCTNNLDNSDEHIILDSLNGKLHSKNIICSECNNFFASNLDSIAKDFFNPILLILDFKIASGIITENIEGEDNYLIKKGQKVIHRKPKVIETKIDGKTLVSISGDPKNSIKLFDKYVERLEKKGSKKIASRIEKKTSSEPLRIKVNFKSSPKIKLLLNKIVIEYCALNLVVTEQIKLLVTQVRSLNENFDNVYFTNPKDKIRDFNSGEISHYLKLWSSETTVYAYIELLNVICATVVIAKDYKGEAIDFQYYQDAITGKKINEYPIIENSSLSNVVNQDLREIDFGDMANKLFSRKRDRDFTIILDEVLLEIKERLEKEIIEGKITEPEFNDKYVQESTEFIAQYQIENPYMWEDLDDANNDVINYIHSNLREEQFDSFCKKYSNLIGKKIRIDGKKMYIVEKFKKIPVTNQNGIQIINVRIVLFNGIDREYIPYRDFFEGISQE